MRLLLALVVSVVGCSPARTPVSPTACPLSLGVQHSRRIDAAARARCEQACSSGDRDACVVTSIALEDGRGGPKDLARARALAEQQCAAKHPPGCTRLGTLDDSRAQELFDRACRLGDPVGCINLGWLYEKGDVKRAAALYQQACDAGEPTGCSNLGWLHGEGLIDGQKRPQLAMTLFERACSAGSPAGCDNLAGHLHDEGKTARALELWERACADDYGSACVNLAIWLAGTDNLRARKLLEVECREETEHACDTLRELNEAEAAHATDGGI